MPTRYAKPSGHDLLGTDFAAQNDCLASLGYGYGVFFESDESSISHRSRLARMAWLTISVCFSINRLSASILYTVSVAVGLIQSLVTVASDDFSGEGGKRVFAQVFVELLGFGDFTALGAGCWVLGAGWGLCRSASV